MVEQFELAVSSLAEVGGESDAEIGIFLYHRTQSTAHIDIPVHLFLDFAQQRVVVALTFLYLATRKLPVLGDIVVF